LLPPRAPLLLAVSGGQDSMALTALLRDLRPLHGWRLWLWHGDHRWRPESAEQARQLAAWAAEQGLPMRVEPASDGEATPRSEAAARRWRYACLAREARRRDCRHVVTGHTGSDRAETVLLNLARGCHSRGLAGLRASSPLPLPASGVSIPPPAGAPPLLVRPLLPFSRSDTARICRQQGLPVWPDPSNRDPRFGRNRVRAEVLPVLEALHPGAARRISDLAERLAEEEEGHDALAALALGRLAADPAEAEPPTRLSRPELAALPGAARRRLLARWLRLRRLGVDAALLEELGRAIAPGRPPGQRLLAGGWRLCWDRRTLSLFPPCAPDGRPCSDG
jgi:tRNA(Ile)-lysidine synthase